jgi:hypothetical protein
LTGACHGCLIALALVCCSPHKIYSISSTLSVGYICAATEKVLDRLIRRLGHELGCLMFRNARSAALGGAVAAAVYVSHGTSQVRGPVGERIAHL